MDLFEWILIPFLAGVAVAAIVMGTRLARDLGVGLWDRHEQTLPTVEPARPADRDTGPDGRTS